MAAWTKEQAEAARLKSLAVRRAKAAAKAAGQLLDTVAAHASAAEEVITPEAPPAFDPERLAAQVGSGAGLPAFVQGKHLFTTAPPHRYIGEAPKNLWYFPSEIEEANNRRTRAKQRQLSNRVPQRGGAPPLPQRTIDAQRENAMALAAETHAE